MQHAFLGRLGINVLNAGVSTGGNDGISASAESCDSYNPATEESIARVLLAEPQDYEYVIKAAQESFLKWRMVPAPKRGEIVREIADELRHAKEDLGALVSLETGKILAEGIGEVQEMIDIADFAVGLSRQLYGHTMPSERPGHRLYEQWHPLGVVGVITAFNFPVAVWSWNAFIAAVCGDTVVWKPSLKSPLTAIAVQNICNKVCERHDLSGIFNLCIGDDDVVGARLVNDARVSLVSATGSCDMGRKVGPAVSARLGRHLLELGGNNGVIVTENADLNLTARAIYFGAVGTAGQRCTSIRRCIVHKSVAGLLTVRLVKAYKQTKIGDPLLPDTLMGPLIDEDAVNRMQEALARAKEEGGIILSGGKYKFDGPGFFVEPTIVFAQNNIEISKRETFAPILYIIHYETLDEAIAIHNSVPQGLSSAIFTQSLEESEQFLSAAGSDCGIANVNTSTSGAEIGCAFGGEKDTGGGREAGSDAWKAYMRRQAVAINYSGELPLAQGIKFGTS